MKSNGIQVLNGIGTVHSPNKILVERAETSTTVNCGKLILATGSSPLRPDVPGSNFPCVITSNELLNMETIPERLGIIGGGVIGGKLLAALGIQVKTGEFLFYNNGKAIHK